MNIVKRILSDLDDSFLMPSQIDLMEFKFEGNLFELNFHSEFYDYFSDEFKQKLHNYKIKPVLNDGWYSFTIPVNKRKEFVSLVDKQWHKLRSECRSKWLKRIGKHSKKQIIKLSKFQEYKCAYCGSPYSEETGVHEDHVIPLSNGGSNHISNIVLACSRCNIRKSNQNVSYFINNLEKDGIIKSRKIITKRFNSIMKFTKSLESES